MTTFRDNLLAGKTAFIAGGTSGINLGIAKRFAKGRIVSCLEGGYNLHALARSVEAHVRVLADV